MKNVDLSLISYMYFRKDMSQSDIAERLGLSKVAVSRILQRAKKYNIYVVDVKLPFDRNDKLENILKERYNLKDAVVVKKPESVKEGISKYLGKVGAFYLNLTVKDNCIIGIGIGHTIGHLVNALMPMKMKNVFVVQLQGGLTNVEYYNPFSIVQKICEKLDAQGTYITSSAIVNSKEQRDLIIHKPSIGEPIYEIWQRCDKALFGIGTIDKSSFIVPNIIGKKEIEEIKRIGSVGNIMGHCFNLEGEFLKNELEEKLVSIPVNMIFNIPERIAIAGGNEKVYAIKGALSSGIITILMTDEKTAKEIINLEKIK